MKTKTTHITKTTETVKTPKISCTWKRGLCVALASLLLGLTACSAKTPAQTAGIGAAAGANTTVATEAQSNPEDLLAATPEDVRITEAPETTAPVQTEAATEPAATEPERKAYQCGENLTWAIDSYVEGVTRLEIKGSGAMFDYDEENHAPWYDRRDDIDIVVLPDGLTSIGSDAFCDLTKMESFDIWGGNMFKIPDSVSSIGSGAFRNCASLHMITLPESVSSIADSAFSGSGLRELWVMNPDCAIAADETVSPELKVCGFPDSTAEQFAAQSGCSFDPMISDPDAVAAQLRQAEGAGGTRINWIAKSGTGYMAKVVVYERISATEAELLQARQSGSIVLNGEEHAYTESREQAEKWGYVYEDDEEAEGWSGWIQGSRSACPVRRIGDLYYFFDYYTLDGDYLRYEEPTDVAWLFLGDDTLTYDGEVIPFSEFFTREFDVNYFNSNWFYYDNLTLTEDGNILVMPVKFGAKR